MRTPTHHHSCPACGQRWPHNARQPCGIAAAAVCPPCEEAIKRGVADAKAGRTRPWAEVRVDLGL